MNYDMMAKKGKSVIDNLRCLGPRAAGRVREARQGLLIATILMLLWGPGGWAQEAGTAASVSSQLATELVRYFPPVTGEVIKVNGRQIYVDLGVKDEMWKGLRLSVFRQGEALKHPSTGAVVGYDEQVLGHITLVQLSENHSVGVYMQAAEGESVQPGDGDKVRLTAGRIRVSLLPPDGPLPANLTPEALSTQLRGDLEATGRFRVESVEQVNAWLMERGLTPARAVQAPYLQMLTKSLQTPYVVQPTLKAVQDQSILALRLLASTQTEPVAEASAVLASGVAVAGAPSGGKAMPAPVPPSVPGEADKFGGLFRQPLQVQPGGQVWNMTEGMTELHRLDEELIGLDAGDPDGDGQVEVVAATDSRISLYQLRDQSLQLIDSFQAGQQGRFISAQLVRLNPGSPLGIVVNQQIDTEGVDSFVLALRDRQLAYWQKHIYETLLAVDSDGDGINDRIWTQTVDDQRFFSRDHVQEYVPGNGKLQFRNNLKVPYPFRVTGAALVRLGTEAGASPHLVFVDERNRLRVYRDQEKLWESADFVGGSYAEAQLSQGGEVDVRIGKIITNSFAFEPIPEAVDVDGDGVKEVLVIRNGASLGGVIPNRTRYTTGDVALLRVGPYGYNLSPVSPKFDGMVSGVSVVPSPTPGVLIAISKRQGIFGRKQQTIIFLSRLPLS
ncbi:hypothetical protein [Candidatus Entotheonella palauensis]|uniref:hypothetical protein n=1 Tax=Candidatus Entotheonella palauensis TaxID=93172 RepID=UPI001177FF7F|nr:hypothetical protein [Candidatus Entotheonella palauensis]